MTFGTAEIITMLLSGVAVFMAGFVYYAARKSVLSPIQQLEEWRRNGVLRLGNDETASLIAELGEENPLYLRALVKDIRRMMEDHDLGPGDGVQLILRVARETEREAEPRISERRLELSYALPL